MGVDNVSIDYVGSIIIPEANTAALFVLPAALLLTVAVRKRGRSKVY